MKKPRGAYRMIFREENQRKNARLKLDCGVSKCPRIDASLVEIDSLALGDTGIMNGLDLGIYPPERAFSILLLQLGDYVEKGKGDETEADSVRDLMGDYWNSLSEEQRQRMRWLSEDLADLGKGRPPIVQQAAG